jgi:hypothetical protein
METASKEFQLGYITGVRDLLFHAVREAEKYGADLEEWAASITRSLEEVSQETKERYQQGEEYDD